jgi:Flp pilus assembly protein TadD
LLGAVREAADRSGATVLIVSDHGFKWHDGRPTSSSVAVATAGQWHRDEGIYVLWGRDVTADATLGRGGVAQVSATVLALLGLPPGRGLAGPPLPGAPASPVAAVDYDAGYRPARPAAAAAPAAEQVEKLRALGYIGADRSVAPGGAQGGETRTAASFNNEGLILAEQGRTREAKEAFARALALDPATTSARWNLSDRLWADGEHARADALLLEGLDGSTEVAARLRARLRAHVDAGDAEGGRALLQRAVTSRPQDPALRLLRGRASLDAGQCRPALDDFEVAARGQPGDPVAHASVGLARLCLGDGAGARRAFARSLALDPAQPELRRYVDDGR